MRYIEKRGGIHASADTADIQWFGNPRFGECGESVMITKPLTAHLEDPIAFIHTLPLLVCDLL